MAPTMAMNHSSTLQGRANQGMTCSRILLTILMILLTGCSSLPLKKARHAFYGGDPSRADLILNDCKKVSPRDQLLCHMEKGLILHDLGAYEKSTGVLLESVRLIKAQDQISIKEQSSAVLLNDNVTIYKGEYCEQLWVHTFLMMNFLLQHKNESALVEAKQALEVFDRYPVSLENDYFTRALIALCYENMNLWDDARIEYDKLSRAMGQKLDMPVLAKPGTGELILFVGQGRIPQKVSTNIILPPSIRISIPRYKTPSEALPLVIRSDGQILAPLTRSTNMGAVAEKALEQRSTAILSRQVLRAGAKEAIAQQFGKENQFLEDAARIILFLLEEADTRSWELLPGRLMLVRIKLDTGVHNLEISSGFSKTISLNDLNITEGTRVYRSLRF